MQNIFGNDIKDTTIMFSYLSNKLYEQGQNNYDVQYLVKIKTTNATSSQVPQRIRLSASKIEDAGVFSFFETERIPNLLSIFEENALVFLKNRSS